MFSSDKPDLERDAMAAAFAMRSGSKTGRPLHGIVQRDYDPFPVADVICRQLQKVATSLEGVENLAEFVRLEPDFSLPAFTVSTPDGSFSGSRRRATDTVQTG